MIGIGPVELLVILLVTLIVVGPEKMPELARNLAKLMRDLRSAMDDVREQFNEFTREDLLPTKEIVMPIITQNARRISRNTARIISTIPMAMKPFLRSSDNRCS